MTRARAGHGPGGAEEPDDRSALAVRAGTVSAATLELVLGGIDVVLERP